jgi:hypothetical protein
LELGVQPQPRELQSAIQLDYSILELGVQPQRSPSKRNGPVYYSILELGVQPQLRGMGSLSAQNFYTMQLDSAPNITSGTLSASYNGTFSGASYKLYDAGTNTGSGVANWPVARLNASLVNKAYGRRQEIAPVNYSVYYHIKF